MDKELARTAAEALLDVMEWARNLPDQFLDGDDETRLLFRQSMDTARAVVKRLYEASKE